MFCSSCGSQLNPGSRFCNQCGAPISSAPPAAYAAQPGTTHPSGLAAPHAGPPYAGFWLRVGAYLIDGVILAIPVLIVEFLLIFRTGILTTILNLAAKQQSQAPDQVAAQMNDVMRTILPAILKVWLVVFLVSFVTQWLYFSLMESSSKQATIGKIALGLYVTDMQGQRISFGRATARSLTKIGMGFVPLGSVGYILAGFTERKQALEDFAASTLVYRKN
jgi:uncharacterized RDD family membrane protein YckC